MLRTIITCCLMIATSPTLGSTNVGDSAVINNIQLDNQVNEPTTETKLINDKEQRAPKKKTEPTKDDENTPEKANQLACDPTAGELFDTRKAGNTDLNNRRILISYDEESFITKLTFNRVENPQRELCVELRDDTPGKFSILVPGFFNKNQLHSKENIRLYLNPSKQFSQKRSFDSIVYILGLQSVDNQLLEFTDEYVLIKSLNINDIGKLLYAAFIGDAIKDIEFKQIKIASEN